MFKKTQKRESLQFSIIAEVSLLLTLNIVARVGLEPT